MTPASRIEELEKLLRAATDGPWALSGFHQAVVIEGAHVSVTGRVGLIDGSNHKADATFIAAIKTAAPGLLACAKALEEIRDRHVPDQPMADDSDEADYVRKHHTELRNIAHAALALLAGGQDNGNA